ncbi:MAG: hypothetical protein ACQESF_01960 [Nanobdellota archaeon]
MQDKTLLLISLFFSLFGLVFLFIFSDNVKPEKIGLDNEDGDAVRVVGVVENVRNIKNLTMIDLAVRQKVKIVVFENISVDAQKLDVTGDIQNYKGQQEVIAKSIKVVD